MTIEAYRRLPPARSPEARRVSAVLREREIRGRPSLTICEDPSSPGFKEDHPTQVTDLLESYPTSIAERIERTLLNVADLSPRLGEQVKLTSDSAVPVAFGETKGEADFVLGYLVEAGLTSGMFDAHSGREPLLTVDGWATVSELREGAQRETCTVAMIAMAFRTDTREDCESGLTSGISGAGYEHWIADRVEFDGPIDDEVLSAIRRSQFVVADLTAHRPNVYFEAGFARGLGKPVLYTCHKPALSQTHFDIRQFNIIDWTDAEELARRLQARIEAVVGPAR